MRAAPREPLPEPKRRVPLSTRILFGSGSAAEGVKNTAFNVFLLFYYNQVLGLSGTLSGLAIFLALCVDAVTDPLVGAISDNFHSRLGRRHPFMYASALPMALCFFLLFDPPAGLSPMGLFAWLTAFAVGVRASMTLYMIPSASMMPEMTPIYDERTALVSYRYLFGWMGGLAISLLGYLVFFAPSEQYADGRLDPGAYAAFSLTGAAIIAAAIVISSAGTHRLIGHLGRPTDPSPLTAARFFEELRPVLANRSYRMLVVAALFASVAGGFGDVVGLYVNTYFWEFRTDQIAIIVYGLAGSVVLAFAVTRPITELWDKRSAALGLAVFAVLLGPLPIFLRLLDLMPPNGDPRLLALITVHTMLMVAAVVAIGITVASMIADTVDENELVTGRRQEGLFVSAISFTSKATSGVGGLLAGVALDAIAFPRMAEAGSVEPEKVFALGLVVGPGLMGLFLVTLVFLSRYDITRARHGEIRAALAVARGERR